MSKIIKSHSLIGEYCNSLTSYSRYKTKEVFIGDIPLGGDNPIRVQSMTTIDTMDTKGSIEQSIRMIEAGCEYVRITAPSLKEAENLRLIKKGLRDAGFNTPLIADIHFTPNAAELAATIVEKVRVNPGNYADKKKFQQIEYNDADYQSELDRIRKRFSPLVEICKDNGTAMRIGTNHGSLSDRILSRYGDTPLGMVESAMEFIRICEDLKYQQLILSMKASNPQTMVQAYRLLVKTMNAEGMNYPLHLGVTEAGDGEDGRVKSSVGIGSLLEDGLGDTIRVSLTEEPEEEVPVAKILAERYHGLSSDLNPLPINLAIDPYHYSKRKSHQVLNFGGDNVPRIIADFSVKASISQNSFKAIGYKYDEERDKYQLTDSSADCVLLNNKVVRVSPPGNLMQLVDSINPTSGNANTFISYQLEEWLMKIPKSPHFLQIDEIYFGENIYELIKKTPNAVLIIKANESNRITSLRKICFNLIEKGITNPIVFHVQYATKDINELQIHASTDLGAFFVDGIGDGILISAPKISSEVINSTAFSILQSTRTRISRTEYISCPSCGRTLFDLQETTQKIKAKTDHLKGVKIGIMGCIVNGPGEMADADYGYVGTGPGKISLFKGQEVVKKNVPSTNAVDELINLIKDNGDWVNVPTND
ncbi:MAG: (E)-4-hydroxy-3-methylbut-2-enyl-diphosphate synthase [Sphingobacteriales bacterium]|jgi:(E)-4-hydroxy-3-methylbut-2-enyl-diphosphate synthase